MGPETTYHRRRRGRFALAGAALALALLARVRPFRAVVRGPSMGPTLLEGDVVLAFGGARAAAGDVVVIEHPGRPGYEMIKRVAGAPGDTVMGMPGGAPFAGPVPLGPDEWFVVGDSADASTDSRSFGPVRSGHLRGVVRFVLWPAGRAGRVIRFR